MHDNRTEFHTKGWGCLAQVVGIKETILGEAELVATEGSMRFYTDPVIRGMVIQGTERQAGEWKPEDAFSVAREES